MGKVLQREEIGSVGANSLTATGSQTSLPPPSMPPQPPTPHLPWTSSLVIVCLNESMLRALCVDLIMFNSLAHSLFISVTVSAYFCRKSGSVGILVNSLVKFEFDPIFE